MRRCCGAETIHPCALAHRVSWPTVRLVALQRMKDFAGVEQFPGEVGGPKGPEPTRVGELTPRAVLS